MNMIKTKNHDEYDENRFWSKTRSESYDHELNVSWSKRTKSWEHCRPQRLYKHSAVTNRFIRCLTEVWWSLKRNLETVKGLKMDFKHVLSWTKIYPFLLDFQSCTIAYFEFRRFSKCWFKTQIKGQGRFHGSLAIVNWVFTPEVELTQWPLEDLRPRLGVSSHAIIASPSRFLSALAANLPRRRKIKED